MPACSLSWADYDPLDPDYSYEEDPYAYEDFVDDQIYDDGDFDNQYEDDFYIDDPNEYDRDFYRGTDRLDWTLR